MIKNAKSSWIPYKTYQHTINIKSIIYSCDLRYTSYLSISNARFIDLHSRFITSKTRSSSRFWIPYHTNVSISYRYDTYQTILSVPTHSTLKYTNVLPILILYRISTYSPYWVVRYDIANHDHPTHGKFQMQDNVTDIPALKCR